LNDGTFWRNHPNGSTACLVWFAGIREPFLNPAFLTSLPGTAFDGLFFRDLRDDWYMAGFTGELDFPGSIAWLRGVLKGYQSVFIGGQSSGAYAALRISRYIGPTATIAFSPQTRNITKANGETLPWVAVKDLSEEYSDWDYGFPIYIHVARSEADHKEQYFWDDWNQIKPFLEMNRVTIIRHPFDCHAVSMPLYDQRLFYRSILATALLHLPLGETAR